MTTYYVSPTGSDTNAGTQTLPWRTIQHGIDTNIVRGGDTVIVSGNIDFSGSVGTNGTPLYLVNKSQPGASGTNPVTIQGATGNIITCDAGPQGYSSCNYWVLDGLNIRVKPPGNGSTVGVYFAGQRANQSVNNGGSGGDYITVKNCTFDTTTGSGFINRDGIGIWGYDHITVTGNKIKHTSNDTGSGGGSAISIGQPWNKSSEAGIHVRIERNLISLIGPGTADNATDRNAIILDEYHTDSSGGPTGPAFPNFGDGHPGLVGDTLVANNIIMNITGRGIHVLKGGYAQSKIGIINNTVIGPFAQDPGNLFPPCGIGGYGDNRSSNVTCFNNLVMDGNLHAGAYNWYPAGMDSGDWTCANNWSYNGNNTTANGDMTVAQIGIIGGTSGTQTILSDNFTQANGSAPSSSIWLTPNKSTGATIDIQGNQLRFLGGTLGSFNDYMRLQSIASATNFTLVGTCVLTSDVTHDHYTAMFFRGSGVTDTTPGHLSQMTTGYYVEIGPKEGYIALFRRDAGGIDTNLGQSNVTFATGDIIVTTVVANGTSINVSYTRNGGSSTSVFNGTDATYSSGPFSLGLVGGSDDTVADQVRWDSISVTTSGTGNPSLTNPTTDGLGDYRPSSSSPLRLAGIASLNGWSAPTIDFYGQTRPSTPTIGAAEPVVAVNVPPVANFSFSPTNAVIGSAVQFTDLSTGTPTSWLWDFGDGSTSTLQNPSHTYTSTSSSGPNPEAISGMSSTPVFNENFNDFSNWFVYDASLGSTNSNGEKSVLRAANATILTDATADGGKCARLIVKRESYMGGSYTGVQMECSAFRFGNGNPFYVEVRLRWTPYVGAWYGPWMYDEISGSNAEVDIMETVNLAEPRYALHSPNFGPSAYGPAQDPGQWHIYGLRFDRTGWKSFYDGVKLSTNANASVGTAFVNAKMLMKVQHLCGGSYPDGEAGFTTPLSTQAMPQNFDIDYYRVYQ